MEREQMQAQPASRHQPTKAEMEEPIAINGTPEDIAKAMLEGGAERIETTQAA